MKTKTTAVLTAALLGLGLFLGLSEKPVLSASRHEEEGEGVAIHEYIRLFSDAFSVIRENYVEEVPVRKIIYGAIKGMVKELDDYSQFMEPETTERVREDSEGEFGGLGIRIAKEGDYVKVITPMPNTPAYRIGVLPGDLIVEIEGESARGISLEEAVNRLRGPEGSQVTISVKREEEDDYLEFTITRDTIVPRKVFSRVIDGDTAYIRITDFSGNAPQMFRDAFEEKLEAGNTSLILDLRNNPGGLLTAAIEVAEMFIERGELIVYTQGRAPTQSREFYANRRPVDTEIPVVILINKGSASGSEIVAGCLQDHGRAILLGETTFGKASVQSIINLEDESALRLTTAEYYTPGGNPIHDKGVAPDIEVKLSSEERRHIAEKRSELYLLPEEERLEKEAEISDPQLDRAADILRARKIFMRDK